jgi:hypothetical protein
MVVDGRSLDLPLLLDHRPPTNATAALNVCKPPPEDIYDAFELVSTLTFYSLAELSQKWQGQFSHPQQKKIPPACAGRPGFRREGGA